MTQRPQRACVAQQQQQRPVAAAATADQAVGEEQQQQEQQSLAAVAGAPEQQQQAASIQGLQAALLQLSMAVNSKEADAALAAATTAALPLLRGCMQPQLVASMRESLGLLHAEACAGRDTGAVLQQALTAARELGENAAAADPAAELAAAASPAAAAAASPVEPAAIGGKRKPSRIAAAAPAKRARSEPPTTEQQAWLLEQPCGGCRDPDGEQVLCDFCMGSWHLGCHRPPLEAVPPGTWLCAACSSVEGRLAETEAALELHARWVQAKVPRVRRPFLGQLSYWAQGRLSLQFQDGEQWTHLTLQQASGRETLEGFSWIKLLPVTASVPMEVLQMFESKGWLVSSDNAP